MVGRRWRVARRHPGITAVSTAAAAIVLAVATFAYSRVVSAHNVAIEERDKKVKALDLLEALNRKQKDTYKDLLRKQIELTAVSGAPNSHSNGLELVKQAAELEPVREPGRASRLGCELLAAARNRGERSGDCGGPIDGLLFVPGWNRLAVCPKRRRARDLGCGPAAEALAIVASWRGWIHSASDPRIAVG